ncbi:MAG: restriction endonuclease subunit S [Rhodanobacter sp.]
MEVREASGSYVELTELPCQIAPFGYKHTEVGLIPDDWQVANLGSLARGIHRGASPRPIDDPQWFDTDSSIGWVRISDVTQAGRYLNETTQRLSPEGIRRSRYLPRGALIMSICATVGRPVETRIDVCIHDGFVVFERPSVDQGFLYHVLKGLEPKWARKGQTGSQMNLNTGLIKETEVPVPPTKAEQQAIAEALSDADVLIESLQQLIAKKRQIKRGTMQTLLTGKRRLPGFRDAWMSKEIGDLLTIMHGKSQHEVEDEAGCYPILATGGQIGSTNTFLYDKPSVLIGRKGTIDRPQYMDTPFWSVDTLFYSVIHQPNVAKYVFYRFCLIDWRAHNEASGVPSLNARTVEQIELDVPLADEQTAIATILTDMDTELTELETRLAKTSQLKQGMMQELLTGRIRLVSSVNAQARSC